MQKFSLHVVGQDDPPPEVAGLPAPWDFDVAFRRFAPYVARIAYKLTGNNRDSEEICQEVFLRLSRNLHKIASFEELRPWLATVTVRTAGRHMHRFRFWKRVRSADAEIETPGFHASGEDKVILSEAYRTLLKLPLRQRTVWILFYAEGHRLEEIADICKLSLSTTKRDLAAAKAALTEAFDER